jgi:hypothetical protein
LYDIKQSLCWDNICGPPKLKCNKFNQFSMSESTRNIFLNHSGHIREDICGSSKKIHARTIVVTFNSNFWGTISVDPNIEMDLVQSVFNIRKYLNNFFTSLWSHKRRHLWFKQDNSLWLDVNYIKYRWKHGIFEE